MPWQLTLLLIAMAGLGSLLLNIILPALPALMRTFATDTGSVQLTVSLYLVAMAVAQLVAGSLADRFGRRPVVLSGLALVAAACLVAVVAASIGQLIISRMVQAGGAAAGVVVGRAIIRDLFDRDRAASMIGLVTAATMVSPMVAPLIGGMIETAFGWRAIFILMAATAFIVLGSAAVVLPETRTVRNAGRPSFSADLWRLIANPTFAGYALTTAFGSVPFFLFLGGAPHLTITLMGRSSAEFGIWFGVCAFGYMAGNFAVSRLAARHGVNQIALFGILIQIVTLAAGLGLTVIAPRHLTPAIMFVTQTVSVFGNGLLLPAVMAGAISVRPQAAGTASGIVGFGQMGMAAICVQLGGYVAAQSTDLVTLAATMTVGSASMVLPYILVRLRERSGAQRRDG